MRLTEKVIEALESVKDNINDEFCSLRDIDRIDAAIVVIRNQAEELAELREDLTEMSTNGGTGNQQDVCNYLLNLMDVIEKNRHEWARLVDWRADND